MTVTNSTNKAIFAGNGVQTAFTFAFNAGYAQGAPSPATALSYLSVIATDSSGNQTAIAQGSGANQCQITLNAPVAGALWGLGGTITYDPGGTPLPAGSTLTVVRTVPLTQLVSLSNQGSMFPQTVEMALDLLEFQIQQLNESYGRALVAPVVDATAPLPLPAIAQRANQALLFDASGNPIAGAAPSSGIISSAMQPVVDAATLALGRSALGLGSMAVEGIGAGLQDDGSGNVRVNEAFTSDATNQSVGAAFHLTQRIATGPFTYTLARANTLWNGFSFDVYVTSGVVVLNPDAHDTILGLSSGTALTLAAGVWYTIATDGVTAGNWYVAQQRAPLAGLMTSQLFLGAQTGTYVTPAGARMLRVRYCAGGGASGSTSPVVAPSGTNSSFNGVVATAGGGGIGNNGATGGVGGASGATGSASTAAIRRYPGQAGDAGSTSSGATTDPAGARGGSTAFFGGGAPAAASTNGTAPVPNSGAGAGGYAGTGNGGAGAGGGGECIEMIITNPAASYAFTVGAGGAASGSRSVAGADGQLLVEEYY